MCRWISSHRQPHNLVGILTGIGRKLAVDCSPLEIGGQESARKVIRAYGILRVTHQTNKNPDTREPNGGTEGVKKHGEGVGVYPTPIQSDTL